MWLCLASPAYGSLLMCVFMCMCVSVFYVYVKCPRQTMLDSFIKETFREGKNYLVFIES